MRIARRYVVSGRVQGVGFRFFTHEAAAMEGIQGWVRNRADGAVEIAAEGEAEAIERFERRIRTGPPHARVDAVDATDMPTRGHAAGFTVR